MLDGCLETSDRCKVEHGGDRGDGRWCRTLRAGGLDRLMSCSGQGCARRGGRAGKVAGEGVEEAATSACDQIGDQTRGRPKRSEQESIERCAQVSYRGDGVALRTGCVNDVDGQGTTRLVHGCCAR